MITDAPNGRGGTWNADGVILFAPGVSRVRSCACPSRGGAGGTRDAACDTGSGPTHRLPQFLPDGKRFLFSSTLGTAETNGVYLGSLDKTPPVRLVPDDRASAASPPPRRCSTIRQGALQAYRFDPDVRHSARASRSSSRRASPAPRRTRVFAASDTGVLAYRAGTAQRRQLVWVNRQGTRAARDWRAGDAISSPRRS